MAYDIVSVPPFPSVPNLPGVPGMPRLPLGAAVGRLNGATTAANIAVDALAGAVPQADAIMGQVNTAVDALNAAAGGYTGGVIAPGSALALAYYALPPPVASLVALGDSVAPSLAGAAGALEAATSTVGASLTAAGFQQPRLTADSPSVASTAAISALQWGLFSADGSTAILTGDAVLEMEILTDSRTPDYPIEDGGFQNYNKTQFPTEGRVSISKGGSLADRQAFISKIHGLRTSLTLYSLVMAEGKASNVNVLGVSYSRRAERGAQLVVAEIRVREVRTGAVAAFSNTKDPVSAATQASGPVQAQAATPTQTASVGTVQ